MQGGHTHTRAPLSFSLQAECRVLPPSCERFIKLLEQAARLHPTVSDKQHPIGLCLASELQATNHSLLTTMIVLEPLCLISLTGMPECLSALMRVAPPSDEWKAKAIQELEQRAMALKMPGVDTTDGLLPNAVETALALLKNPPQPPQQQAEEAAPAATTNDAPPQE